MLLIIFGSATEREVPEKVYVDNVKMIIEINNVFSC